MGFPKILVTKARPDVSTTEEAAVYVLDYPNSLRLLGSTFGGSTVEAPASGHVHHPANYAIKFKGKIYAWVRNTIREYDPATNSWSTAHTVSDQLSSNGYAYHTGLYFAVLGGAPTIFGAYQNSSNFAKVVRFDGTTWSQVGGNYSTAGHGYWGPAFLYRNKLWIPTSHNGTERHVLMNPITGEGGGFNSNSATESNTRTGGSYVVFKGRLLGIHMTNPVNRTWVLFEFSGQWAQLQTIQSFINSNIEQYAGAFIWATSSAVYIFLSYFPAASQVQFKLLKLTPTGSGDVVGETFTVTDISNPVLPAWLRTATTYSGNSWRFRVSGYVDYTNPTTPRVLLWILQDSLGIPSSPAKVFEFVDDVTEVIDYGEGHSTALALPHTNFSAGEYSWDGITDLTKTTLDVESLTLVNGVYTIGFRVSGGDGLTGRTVKLYFATEQGLPMTLCTLVAATATGGSATNTAVQVSNVSDDGSVLHTVIWDAASQGITSQSKPVLTGTVE